MEYFLFLFFVTCIVILYSVLFDSMLWSCFTLPGLFCTCRDQGFGWERSVVVPVWFMSFLAVSARLFNWRWSANKNFDELLIMPVLIASWWMLLMADLLLMSMSGTSARYCWTLGFDLPFRDRRRYGRSSGRLWQSWWHWCCAMLWHAKANCW